MILTPEWPAPPGVRAAFTLRTGGVSRGVYESFNLGTAVGDLPEAVAENKRRLREQLRLPGEPVWLDQVHGARVVDLEREDLTDLPLQADASVAGRGGGVCAIRVADCMPVLFAARDGSVVGAAHAGWRGLAAGVLESTVRALGVDPAYLLAWMGPAIGPAHFEVGQDVLAAFTTPDPGAATAFAPNPRGRWQCDLYALARRRMEALGIEALHGGCECTYADSAKYFSYRRDGQCGRMAALIWLE